jgi:DNA-binding CsgD family transcriptional regulator
MQCLQTPARVEGRSAAIGRRRTAIPAAWAVASAEIVECIDDPVLPEVLGRALSTLIEFQYSVMFIYRGRGGPIHIHDTFDGPQARVGIANYVKSTYVLNPLYNAYQCGLKTGVYRLRDLASDGQVDRAMFRNSKVCLTAAEEIGYLTEGWPAGHEELCIAMELPGGECAEVTLSQKAAHGCFADKDIASLSPVIPFLTAAVRRHWRRARLMYLSNGREKAADHIHPAFGRHGLSPRERELAQLLLGGHSNASVGHRLGISTTTVKTHSKNLYAKLGIGSQCEFFSLFRDSSGRGGYT